MTYSYNTRAPPGGEIIMYAAGRLNFMFFESQCNFG